LRLHDAIEVTSTFKQVKRPGSLDGGDPLSAPLYVFDPERQSYVPIDAALYERIGAGNFKV
jgi:fatty-acyl-CoA synthase